MCIDGILFVGASSGTLMHSIINKPCFGLTEEQCFTNIEVSRAASILWALYINTRRIKTDNEGVLTQPDIFHMTIIHEGSHLEYLWVEEYRLLTIVHVSVSSPSTRYLVDLISTSFCKMFAPKIAKQKASSKFAAWDSELEPILIKYANHIIHKILIGFSSEWAVAMRLPSDPTNEPPAPNIRALLMDSETDATPDHDPDLLHGPNPHPTSTPTLDTDTLPGDGVDQLPARAKVGPHALRRDGLTLVHFTSLGYDRYTPSLLIKALCGVAGAAGAVMRHAGDVMTAVELSFVSRRKPRPNHPHLGGMNGVYVEHTLMMTKGCFVLALASSSQRHDAAHPSYHFVVAQSESDVETLAEVMGALHEMGTRGELKPELG